MRGDLSRVRVNNSLRIFQSIFAVQKSSVQWRRTSFSTSLFTPKSKTRVGSMRCAIGSCLFGYSSEPRTYRKDGRPIRSRGSRSRMSPKFFRRNRACNDKARGECRGAHGNSPLAPVTQLWPGYCNDRSNRRKRLFLADPANRSVVQSEAVRRRCSSTDSGTDPASEPI
jgi:hypothetical protein